MDQIFSLIRLSLTCTLVSLFLFALYLLIPANIKVTLIGSPDAPKLGNGLNVLECAAEWCPSLKEGFKPAWWLPNGHAQTIYSAMANFSQDDPITYERKLLRLTDGGTIGLDIYPSLSVELSTEAPVVVINHGLTGGSHESYVRNIVVWLTKPVDQGGFGARAAVVNFRGCAQTPLTSPHLYCSGSTLDVHTATLFLADLYPKAPMFGVGFSLGAALMTRYLGEQGGKCRLRAAVVLCAPLELRAMSRKLDARRPFPKLYSFTMARKMLSSFSPHLISSSPLSHPDSPLHPHLTTIIDMTARYKWTLRASHVTELIVAKVGASCPGFPFEGLEGFLEWACPGAWVERIRRPTLGISALDDPIVSGDCLPFGAISTSSHFVLATVPHGGHLGWFDGPMTGPMRHRRWHVQPVIEFFTGALDQFRQSDEKMGPLAVREVGKWKYSGGTGWMVVDDLRVESGKAV